MGNEARRWGARGGATGPGAAEAVARLRRHAVALVALFVALGGGAYAAIKLPRHSVGAAQLRNGAVNSAKVRNHSLRLKDFKPGQLPSALGPVIETDRNDLAHEIDVTTSPTAVVGESLPAGAYALSAEVTFDNHTDTNPAVVSCTISAGGDSASYGLYIPGTAAAMQTSLPLQVSHTFAAAGQASVSCQKASVNGSAFVPYASLIAIPASSQRRTQTHG